MRACGLRGLTLGVFLFAVAAAAPAMAQTVTVSPTSVRLPIGGERQLTAYVNGVVSTAVRWSVNGVPGGNSVIGLIDATGRYKAPATPPDGWTVVATATSTANPERSASCEITVRYPIPWLSSLSPNPLTAGSFTLRVYGGRFVAGARVLWNGEPLPTTFSSSTLLVATGTAAQTGTAGITVANPGPGAVSTSLSLSVRAEPTRTATRTATRRLEPTRTFTRRPEPTGTSTRSPTRTATRSEPTSTRTSPPEPTRTATSRSEPTPTRTSPPEPTRTATTRVEPTSTMRSEPTSTATMRAEATRTMTAAAEPTRTATRAGTPPTAGATATATATAAPIPTPDPQQITYGRLLDQTTFGPTQALIAHVAQVGIQGFLDEQFAAPESPWPALEGVDRAAAIEAFFGNALHGQDQLRQRVVFALSEIIVEASNKNTNADEIVPWLQLLSRNAFGNYRTLLREITLDASMGKYLDLANSGVMGGAANENYPREVMQLFSIGLYKLNLDGSPQLDAQNATIPTYTQADVQQLAKALTGWTFSNATGTTTSGGNYNYYPGPMIPVASKHNTQAKTILGQPLPAGQTAQQDLDGAIDIIFNHPNVAPFVVTRLLRALVTSNPSPAYVARVAAVFNDNGQHVRGDLQAVLRAILLDAEARNDTPPASFGRLRTPMQHTIALCRALGIDPGPASQFAYLFYGMNEGLLDAASVFGHYSPLYRLPRTATFAPEFQIYSISDAINRGNFFYLLMYSPWPIDPALQPYVALAGNSTALVNAVDNALLLGRMTTSTRSALLTALGAMPDNNSRVLTALYLTSMSGEYLIQR